MIAATMLALGGIAGFAAGVIWARRTAPPPPEPVTIEKPVDGLVVRGIDPPRELWARGRDWVRLASGDGTNYAPWALDPHGEPETLGFPPILEWARSQRKTGATGERLEAWTEACIAASRIAWILEIPTGEHLLTSWARRAPPTDHPGRDFARWFVGEIGRAGRSGLVDRSTAEVRGPVVRSVHRAAAALVAAVAPGLELVVEPPGGVGPRNRETWLVDEAVAERIGNDVVAGVVSPVIVLRPLLRKGDRVFLEGEVA